MEKITNPIFVLILQHPQEPGVEKGTAHLVTDALENAAIRVGLSWANLSKALGREAKPSNWGVLYLGSGAKDTALQPFQFVSRKGNVIDPPKERLEGLVILDGTWSQAKSLWWRNAWLLKLKRIVLEPQVPSLYGKLRKEPRRACLSTVESVGLVLEHLGGNPAIREKLFRAFETFVSEQMQRHNQRERTGR